MNILSLFDGISCARVALDKAGIPVDKYYASEVDKYTIQIAQKNYPDTIQLGAVCNIHSSDLPDIDILVAGFPCQSFSSAGQQKGFEDDRGNLFFELLRLLNEIKPKYFILENVASMSKANKDIISHHIGTEPIMLDAGCVSAQTRRRYFWCNFHVDKLTDEGLVIKDILKYSPMEDITDRVNKKKPGTLAYKNAHRFTRGINDKVRTLTTGGCNISNIGATNILIDGRYYKLNENQCEILMGLPLDYTKVEGISATQRYRALGNGFSVDVVAHILKCMLKDEPKAEQTKLF